MLNLDHPYNFHQWIFSRRQNVYRTWHTILMWNGKYYLYASANSKSRFARLKKLQVVEHA